MNNEEIKHILELLHFECNPKAREEDINRVLDYITNLQDQIDALVNVKDRLLEENEKLNNIINELEKEKIKNEL